ncbi:MAG: hypothetical protein JXO44_07590, partial [Clostridia bacterium]|nr:hypothetical protein [Clostridia bacterium]
MKGKITLLGQIRRFMHVQWWNHGFGKMMGGVVMVAVYSVTKSVVLWQWPTTFFFKYERGLLACIGFYVLLQLLKQPPTVKGCLKDL